MNRFPPKTSTNLQFLTKSIAITVTLALMIVDDTNIIICNRKRIGSAIDKAK